MLAESDFSTKKGFLFGAFKMYNFVDIENEHTRTGRERGGKKFEIIV